MPNRPAPPTSPGSAQQAVLDAYAALHQQLKEMLALAERHEWEALKERESAYLQRIHQLADLDAQATLNPAQQAHKRELLENIVSGEKAVRRRLSARRDELGELIGLSRRQRNLSRAYGVEANMAQHSSGPRPDPDRETP
ncbi:MAG TPA: flagellar protein FliT [Halomonas sp.]|nr:flagellar protein FliT [Halomonas sp.]